MKVKIDKKIVVNVLAYIKMFSAAPENPDFLSCPRGLLLCNPHRLPELFLLGMKVDAFPPETASLVRSPYHISKNQTILGSHSDQISSDGILTFEPGLGAHLNVT